LLVDTQGESSDLYEMITRERVLSEDTSRLVIKQLISALLYLAEQGYVHRDIKDENILIDVDSLNICLIDFGSACRLNETNGQTIVGTLQYLSPETLAMQATPTLTFSDMWSVGCLLYIMLTGDLPFKTVNQILYLDIPELNESMSKSVKDLLKSLLNKNPNKRASLFTVLQHSWFSN
jgi:serine/threonine protein kinase